MVKIIKKTNLLLTLLAFGLVTFCVSLFSSKVSSFLFKGDNVPFGIDTTYADVVVTINVSSGTSDGGCSGGGGGGDG